MPAVGTLVVRLLVRESRSLKDKRQVVRSVLDRLRLQFGVSASEVDTLDDVRVATLGFAAIGGEFAQVKSTLDAVVSALRVHPSAEFLGGKPSVESFEGNEV